MLDLLAVIYYTYEVGKGRGLICPTNNEGDLLLIILRACVLMYVLPQKN